MYLCKTAESDESLKDLFHWVSVSQVEVKSNNVLISYVNSVTFITN